MGAGLEASNGTLVEAYDLFLVDLDGVAYLGDRPIDGAAEALTAAREAGAEVVFVTNNASRTPDAVAAQLTAMGVPATADEVMTAAVAAAGVLAGELEPGAAVLVVGGDGIRHALEAVGLRPVETADDAPAAVLQGFAPEVGWRVLAEASVAIRGGVPWTATNADVTLPSPRGPLPGNGALVAALVAATGERPRVIGKPERALLDAALAAHPGRRALMIGDRLDTDIAGAHNAALPALLVLSGVSQPADVLAATEADRPQYLGRDLRALLISHPGSGEVGTVESPDGLDGLRDLAAQAWNDPDIQSGSGQQKYADALKALDFNLT